MLSLIRIASGINDSVDAKCSMMANIFLHLIDVPLRSTPAGEKCVRREKRDVHK